MERKKDRREKIDNTERRKINRREKEFILPLKVYLSDTNAFGNVYFAKYFEWQGKAREDWFNYIMQEKSLVLMQEYKMATVEASHQYKHECLPFDEVELSLKIRFSKMCLYFTFIFRFKNTKDIIGIGKQKIAFISNKTNKLSEVPLEIIEQAKKHRMI